MNTTKRYVVEKQETCPKCKGVMFLKKHKFDSRLCCVCKGAGWISNPVDLREALQHILNNKQIKLYKRI